MSGLHGRHNPPDSHFSYLYLLKKPRPYPHEPLQYTPSYTYLTRVRCRTAVPIGGPRSVRSSGKALRNTSSTPCNVFLLSIHLFSCSRLAWQTATHNKVQMQPDVTGCKWMANGCGNTNTLTTNDKLIQDGIYAFNAVQIAHHM